MDGLGTVSVIGPGISLRLRATAETTAPPETTAKQRRVIADRARQGQGRGGVKSQIHGNLS